LPLNNFFRSGLAIDLVLIVMALEAVLLFAWPRLRGSMGLGDIAALMLPGVMLLLGLRNALVGASYAMTAVFLTTAFAFHLWDLARRRRA